MEMDAGFCRKRAMKGGAVRDAGRLIVGPWLAEP
jgi:hypothetical protein